MNLREGTRRLALLLGVVGAIFGGVASYSELQTVREERASYNRFEQLANSDVVKQDRNCILGIVGEQGCREPENGHGGTIMAQSDPIAQFIALPRDRQLNILKGLSPEKQNKLFAEIRGRRLAASAETAPAPGTPVNDWQTVEPPEQNAPKGKDEIRVQDEQGNIHVFPAGSTPAMIAKELHVKPPASEVHKDGIEVINWAKDFGVASIETQDGRTLYPVQAPGVWSYVAIAVLPLLGFFIPWGAIRAIGWVGAGFAAKCAM